MKKQEPFVALEDLRYPPEYLKNLAGDKINMHLCKYRHIMKHAPSLKEQIEALEDQLDETPKGALPKQDFYDQLEKTRSLLQQDTSIPHTLQLVTSSLIISIERITPPPDYREDLEEKACNFFGCTIL